MQRLEFRAMGCQVEALVDAPDAAALAPAPAWFETWEAELSRFRPDSALRRLNRAGGRPVPVSAILWEVLDAALAADEASGGLVTPTLLAALEAAGYDRSFEYLAEAAGAGPEIGLGPDPRRVIRRDAGARTVQLLEGAQLDLNGVAKGWAAERAARRLSAQGPALVNAGGDIAVSGPRRNGAAWPVAVVDPQMPDATLMVWPLRQGGVATSGRDYRRWRQAGVEQHHLLDPRTGRPAVTDVLSATVQAPSLREAEVAAKVAVILGRAGALEWLAGRPELRALLVLDDGQLVPWNLPLTAGPALSISDV